MKRFIFYKAIHMRLIIAGLLALLYFGCGPTTSSETGNTARDVQGHVVPQILSARLIDAAGNDIETQVDNNQNTIIIPRIGQQIGFEITFITDKEVGVEVIVNQYTPMDLSPADDPVFCEGTGCPEPEKGEIPYYGEEIFYQSNGSKYFPITPHDGPRRYTIPVEIEPDIVVSEDQYTEVETENHKEYFLQIENYDIVDSPTIERMFRFQVEDSSGYISEDYIIYTQIRP